MFVVHVGRSYIIRPINQSYVGWKIPQDVHKCETLIMHMNN
jgi:hypothetical protein